MNPQQLACFIKKTASGLGFPLCGLSPCESLPLQQEQLQQWLAEGRHGEMHYLAHHAEKRTNPALLVPGARSVVSVGLPCYPTAEQQPRAPRIARYAFGEDYHFVIKEKLHLLLNRISEESGPVNGRAFTDTAPVMERIWAARSGLGWIGKNGLLLNQKYGSYVLLGEMIIDKETEYDTPVANRCGTCTRCIDACPSGAFISPGCLDARRCLSYLTIEYKAPVHPSSLHGWMFGCDICQEVCPWNRDIPPTQEPAFRPSPELMSWTPDEWLVLTDEAFRLKFQRSPLMRAGLEKLKSHLTKPENG